MRKQIFTIAMVILTMLNFTSCEEMIVSSDQTIDLAPKATISGNVLAELNLQSSGKEAVPIGTQLLVEVSYSDLNPASDGKWMDTIMVSTDGKYSVQVPTDANGVIVTISPFAFVSDQIQVFGSLEANVSKTYSVDSPIIKTISSGHSVLLDITYDKITAAPSFFEKVKITGSFTANLDQQLGGNENVPDGTIIHFYNNSWKDSAIVINGKYSISVPKGVALNLQSKFIYSKNVWNQTTSTYSNVNYEFIYNYVHTFNSMDEVVDIIAAGSGEGKDLTIYPIVSAVWGSAFADLDMSLNGLEYIPDGTIIKFWTNTSPIWGVNVTVNNGQFTVNAPKNQTVYWSTNFNYSKKVEMIDPQTLLKAYVNEEYTYYISGNEKFTDDVSILNLSAGSGTSVNPVFTISGSALAELDDTNNNILENIPNNTQIKFYYPNSNGTIKSATVNNGTYTIDIPKGRSVNYSGTFVTLQTVNKISTFKTFTISGSIYSDGSKTVNIIATNN